MILLVEDENKMVLQDHDGIYTVNRNSKDEWMLVNFIISSDSQNIRIEAIENVDGGYLKLSVLQESRIRDIILEAGKVVNDVITVYGRSDDLDDKEKIYVNKIAEPEYLDRYLIQGQDFSTSDGEKFYGAVSNNFYLRTFLSKKQLFSRLCKRLDEDTPKKIK